jgi:23S rRNA pseudouridine2457 synthase
MIVAFHKPYGVLSQFTPDGSRHASLAAFGFPPEIYPAGRLDADSEGLLVLTDERSWIDRLLNPRSHHPRVYWAQVEGRPDRTAFRRLEAGMLLQGKRTRPARAWPLDPAPELPPRNPPIRFRKNVPDTWIALELTEGRNRQVRHMTAAVGHPTLRLLRASIGGLHLARLGLSPGEWRSLSAAERQDLTGPAGAHS